jgi:hypothetical protein
MADEWLWFLAMLLIEDEDGGRVAQLWRARGGGLGLWTKG